MHEILLQLAEIAHNKQRNTTNIQLHPRRPKVVVISSLFFSSFSLFFSLTLKSLPSGKMACHAKREKRGEKLRINYPYMFFCTKKSVHIFI